jgi:hypothetical protein
MLTKKWASTWSITKHTKSQEPVSNPHVGSVKTAKNDSQYMKSAQVTRGHSLGSAHWSDAKKHGKIPNFTSCLKYVSRHR